MAAVTPLRARGRGERGAELIEFAIVLPLLLLVVAGIMDFGILFQRFEVITNAAREGARLGALPGYTDADITARVTSYLTNGGVATTDSSGGSLVTVTETATTVPAGAATASAIQVSIAYDHSFLFLGPIASLVGGSFGSVTLHATSTMRTEIQAGS